jgi:hypothetical protein
MAATTITKRVDAPKRPRAEIGAIAMQPVAIGLVEWAYPERGELANTVSFLAEMNRVPEADVRGVRFFEVAGVRCARYWLAVHSDA